MPVPIAARPPEAGSPKIELIRPEGGKHLPCLALTFDLGHELLPSAPIEVWKSEINK